VKGSFQGERRREAVGLGELSGGKGRTSDMCIRAVKERIRKDFILVAFGGRENVRVHDAYPTTTSSPYGRPERGGSP